MDTVRHTNKGLLPMEKRVGALGRTARRQWATTKTPPRTPKAINSIDIFPKDDFANSYE